jgi:mRNA-degrading endonuclease RelE of RelBE toxin-antitoxin system
LAWSVDYTDQALRELERIDPVWQRRIVDYLHDVAENGAPRARGKGLVGKMAG